MTPPTEPPAAAPLLTGAEWQRRQQFLGFGPADEEILLELNLVAKTYADEVMDELYGRWMRFDELQQFFPDKATLARVKALQKRYFLRLTAGHYDLKYAAERLHIGEVHRRIGLSPRWYLGAYAIYMQIVFPRVLRAFEHDRAKAAAAINALVKLIALDQELALASYFSPEQTEGVKRDG